jgi:hypothetical protein
VKEPFVCEVCQSVHFLAARKIFLVNVEGGGIDRNWGGSDSYANYLQCYRCATNYVWNAKLLKYEMQPFELPGFSRIQKFSLPNKPTEV